MAKKSTAAEKPPVETTTDSHGRRMPASKSEAVRMAIAAGFDGPQEGSAYIQSQFGLDVSPEHFSSVKSSDKKKEITAAPRGKPGRKPKHAGAQSSSSSPHGEAGLLEALEAMKPLVENLGADKVKRLVDLLG